MKYLYKFFGGRKLFFFFLLLSINTYVLLQTTKWTEGFGYFSVFLYAVVVSGLEGNKVIKGKYKNEAQ